jgi:hypothetical protein
MLREIIFQKVLKQPSLGLKPKTKDGRDLGFWIFSGPEYQPKHSRIKLKPLSVKSQFYNTCGWTASAGAKEIDEGVELDERTLIMFGRERGLISGDGFSNLRDNEKVLQKDGICEKAVSAKALTDRPADWDSFSDPAKISWELRENAKNHRSKTYWEITRAYEIYKAIDDGRPVKIGVKWYSIFNMGQGFSFPWLLEYLKGFFVGGHALYVYGYDLDYHGYKAFIVRNSFGRSYGDNGDCYITEADLDRQIQKYGAYVNLDMDKDIGRWLVEFQGAVVKSDKSPDVFLIQGNFKRKYTDELTLIAHGKQAADIKTVPAEYLDQAQEGDPIIFWQGGNVKQVKELARMVADSSPSLLPQLKKYFSELFK